MVKYTPKDLSQNINVPDKYPIFELLRLIFMSLVALVLIYNLLGIIADWIIPGLPVKTEDQLFKTYIEEYEELQAMPQYTRMVEPVIGKLEKNIPNVPYHFRIKVVNEPVINAIAFPGGNVVVFRGLMDSVVKEEELAFVLAHELGHVIHRDHLKSMGRILVFMVTTSFFLGPDNSLNKLVTKSIKVSELQFSKQQELSADEFAMELMNRTYHHVGPGIRFFERELVDPKANNWVLDFLSTHPDTRERIKIMKNIAKEKGYPL